MILNIAPVTANQTSFVAAHLPRWANAMSSWRAVKAKQAVEADCGLLLMSSMIQPLHPSATQDDIALLYGASFEVSPSSAHLVPLALTYLADGSVLLLDNACHALWLGGATPTDEFIQQYEGWAYPLADGHDRVRALIPDYVSGSETDNMGLIIQAYASCASATDRLFPIWHPHESDEQLEEILYLGFAHIAIGTSPLFPSHQTTEWRSRIESALAIIDRACEATSVERKVHIMDPATREPELLQAKPSPHSIHISKRYKHLIWRHRHTEDAPLHITNEE